MSVKVNPPPQLRIPQKIFADKELRTYFESVNTILFQLWNRTGGNIDAVAGKKVVIIIGSDAVLDNSAFGSLIVVEADTADVTITLPSTSDDTIGEPIEVVINDATFNTTIEPAGGGTIISQPDIAMNRQFQSYPFTAIATNTWVIAGD